MACEGVGLDPQLGYLHEIHPGRPAFALDLVEEFRPIPAASRLYVSSTSPRPRMGFVCRAAFEQQAVLFVEDI